MKHLTAYNERRLQYSLSGAAAVPDPDASGSGLVSHCLSYEEHEVAEREILSNPPNSQITACMECVRF